MVKDEYIHLLSLEFYVLAFGEVKFTALKLLKSYFVSHLQRFLQFQT